MDSLTILTYVFSCCSVAKLYMTLCDPMDYSTLGFPVLHQLPEFPQIHVHWVNAAIEPTHPLPTSSPFASIFHSIRVFSRGFWLFKSGGQSIGDSASASDLPMNIQGWFPLGLTGLFSLQFMGLSRVFSSTIVQKHQFFSALLSSQFNSHPYITAGKTIALTRWTFTHGHHQMPNTEIKLITFFVAEDEEAVYSQQTLSLELTVAQIISFLLKNSGLN